MSLKPKGGVRLKRGVMPGIGGKMSDTLKELAKILDDSGLKLKIGLKQQGHMPTIDRMLSEGKGWNEIAKAIGWSDGEVVKQWYETEQNA